MTQTQQSVVANLATTLHEASMTAEYSEAMQRDRERREQARERSEIVEAAPDDVWSVLARYIVEHASSEVRRVVVRKLVPGLREVNLELSRRIGMAVSLAVGSKDDPDPGVIERVELVPMDPSSWTCTNCGAPYPPNLDACPQCGVK